MFLASLSLFTRAHTHPRVVLSRWVTISSMALDTSSTELFALGIDEVEPWICEDSYANRAILRSNKYMWETVTDEEGMPTSLIRAFSPEALVARRDSVWESRRPIMRDPSNRYSDYITADEYPLDFPMPWWMQQRLRGWFKQSDEGVPEPERRPFPVRCETRRTDGTRCWNWAPSPKKSPHCKQHLPWQESIDLANAQVARRRLLQVAPLAADALEDLVMNAAGEAVRLKAATEILDRVGVRGGMEIDAKIEVEQVDSASAIRAKLEQLAERAMLAAGPAEEIVAEAEVVDERAD